MYPQRQEGVVVVGGGATIHVLHSYVRIRADFCLQELRGHLLHLHDGILFVDCDLRRLISYAPNDGSYHENT
jgi:hypothetical protein